MRNISIMIFSISLLLIGTLSCAHMNIDSSNSESNILLGSGNDDAGYTRMGEFSVIKEGDWLFWGLSIKNHPDVGKLIDQEVSKQNGDGVINLEIKTTKTFFDGFLGIITLGIYTRKTVEISGIVVKHTSSEESMPGE